MLGWDLYLAPIHHSAVHRGLGLFKDHGVNKQVLLSALQLLTQKDHSFQIMQVLPLYTC